MKKHYIDIIYYILIALIFIVGFVGYFLMAYFGSSFQNMIWGMITAVATSLLALAAIIELKKSRETAQMQTSLDFCADMHKQFQEEAFKEREKHIYIELSNHEVCPISDLPEDLQKDIRAYCGFMDNIGVLTEHQSINPDIVIAYYGVEILLNYDLIKPYLDLERLKQSHRFNNPQIPDADNRLIKEAFQMEYAHFELLALQTRERGPKIIKDFRKRLQKTNCK